MASARRRDDHAATRKRIAALLESEFDVVATFPPTATGVFTLCTKNGENVDKSVSTLEALRAFDKEHCFIDYFVRNESLSEDLITFGRAQRAKP